MEIEYNDLKNIKSKEQNGKQKLITFCNKYNININKKDDIKKIHIIIKKNIDNLKNEQEIQPEIQPEIQLLPDNKLEFEPIIKKNKKKNKKINIELNIDDIDVFKNKSKKKENDKYNNIRENIINEIINDNISKEFLNDDRWKKLKYNIMNLIKELAKINNINESQYNNVKNNRLGGRKNSSDFTLFYYNNDIIILELKLEFKFNAKNIKDCPQWVSPMYPSKYMTLNFEDYHYKNVLPQITEIYNSILPDIEEYIKTIHSDIPNCSQIKILQNKYFMGSNKSSQYTGRLDDIQKYKKTVLIAKEGISKFMKEANLKIDLLNEYLYKNQKNKIYILYKDENFNIEKKQKEDYTINPDTIKKTHNTFICKTMSNKLMNILLRWKNGNGIAFPAFQIS